MTDMTSRTGEGRYEIVFKTDDKAKYERVQDVCREQMGHRKMTLREKRDHLCACIIQQLSMMRANKVPKESCAVFLTKGAVSVFETLDRELIDAVPKGSERTFDGLPVVLVDDQGVKAWAGIIATDIDALERL